jgi:hypothetical protein
MADSSCRSRTDVFAEDDLLFHRDRRIEINFHFAHARPVPNQLDAQQLAGHRLEIGGTPPEAVLLERHGVMQPHDERCIDFVQKPSEAVG